MEYIIIGNKIDLEKLREVKEEDIKNNETFVGIEYFETSAKENKNIEESIQKLVIQILQRLKRTGSISNFESSRRNSFRLNNSKSTSKDKISKSCCK